MTLNKYLIATDLDRTLIPNGEDPESPDAPLLFKRLVSHPDILLAFVTGRDKALIEEAIEQYKLPLPDFVISDVGSNIYDCSNGSWEVSNAWQQQISPDWNGFSQRQIADLLSNFNELELQEKRKQNQFKLSYYYPLHLHKPQLQQLITEQLNLKGIKANLIWSVDDLKKCGLLDILPQSANKLHALRFLYQSHDIALGHTLFAGDSGNDIEVMLSDIPSVLVANATDEVVTELNALSAQHHQKHYFHAKGDFLGMNGNYSAGILEGVSHYHPEMIERITGGTGE